MLLKQQGYDVVGIFLKFWKADQKNYENKCCSDEAMARARRIAAKLKIPFYIIDARKEFKKEVVDYFIESLKRGETPNPCVVCNKFIKFKYLLSLAKKTGAEYVATGHYARLKRETPNNSGCVYGSSEQSESRTTLMNFSTSSKNNYTFRLLRGKDPRKDQSYFLWQLSQKELSRIIFPLGDLTKKEVIKIAKKHRLPIAPKESQEICFITLRSKSEGGTPRSFSEEGSNHDTGLSYFIHRYLPKKYLKKGKIIDITNGKIIGEHAGLIFYTIGQRAGISSHPERSKGIWQSDADCHPELVEGSRFLDSAQNDRRKSKKPSKCETKMIPDTPRYYVVNKDTNGNLLIVGPDEYLYTKILIASHLNLLNTQVHLAKVRDLSAQIRYHQEPIKCTVRYCSSKQSASRTPSGVILGSPKRGRGTTPESDSGQGQNDKIKVTFSSPIRAITAGQSIVFYEGKKLVGGGIIENSN